jgi:hypothetical protein
MPDHRDRSPSTLAHGAAKSSDIERVRENVNKAEARSVREEEVSAARHRERVAERVAEREEDAST